MSTTKSDWKFEDFTNNFIISKSWSGPLLKCEHTSKKGRFFLLKSYIIDENSPQYNLMKKEIAIFSSIPLENKPSVLPNYYGTVEQIIPEKNKKFRYAIFDYMELCLFPGIIGKSPIECPHKPLDFSQFYQYFCQALQGLAFLQKQWISHGKIQVFSFQLDKEGEIHLMGFSDAGFVPPGQEHMYSKNVSCFIRTFLELGNRRVFEQKYDISKELSNFSDLYKNLAKKEELNKLKDFVNILQQCNQKNVPDFVQLLSMICAKDDDLFKKICCQNFFPLKKLEKLSLSTVSTSSREKEEDKSGFDEIILHSKISSSKEEIIDFSDFESDELISKGTYGIVHKAHNKKFPGKIFAIKTLSYSSEKEQKKIIREIEIWEKLQKIQKKPKSIPCFYGSFHQNLGFAGSFYHIYFDFYSRSLRNLIDDMQKTKIGFSLHEILKFTENLINSLAFLQTHKICHRDLKPTNLLLDENGNLFLIDFSESKEIIMDSSLKINESTLVGCPRYFSPELEEAEKKKWATLEINSFKSDVFSLGLVLIELGTLGIPKKDDDFKIWEENIETRIKKFKNLYKDDDNAIVNKFAKLLEKCLKIEAEKRPDFIDLFYKFQKFFKKENEESVRNQILLEEF